MLLSDADIAWIRSPLLYFEAARAAHPRLDLLMIFEPFGLLAWLPLPEWLHQFVPAFKATRILTESFCESLPQCLMQSFILVVVVHRTEQLSTLFGDASASDRALLQDVSVLPKSILISLFAMLKTWVELVSVSYTHLRAHET